MLNKPWFEEFRPKNFDELFGQDHVKLTRTSFSKIVIFLVKSLLSKGVLPNLLLYGPAGSGKTSTAFLIRNELYKHVPSLLFSSHFLELNASDDRGIDTVRDQIVNFASNSLSKIDRISFKLVILDEADSMTSFAQNALRRVMEKYSKTVRFILICNYSHSIIPAIQSRCIKLRFSPINQSDLKSLILNISSKSKIDIPERFADVLSSENVADGDARTVLNLLQVYGPKITKLMSNKDFYSLIGCLDPNDKKVVFSDIYSANAISKKIDILCNNHKNYSLNDFIYLIYEEIIEHTENIIEKEKKINILDQLAHIEMRISNNCNEFLQLASIACLFY